jgi:putative transposase
VVLPDHLHCIWCLPERDDDFPTRWRLIKNRFSRQIQAGEPISPSRAGRGERGLWQRRYWEHDIRNEQDLRRHMDYIHYNPVKHGYVTAPPDWPFSSLHRWTARGYARPIGRHRSMWSTWRWVEGDGRFAFVPGNPSPLIRAAPS